VPRHQIERQSSQTTEGDTRRVLAKLESSGKDIALVRLVANWPAGFRPFVLMSDALLFKGELTAVTREVVILYIATARRLEYEWDEHVAISARAGVTDEQRSALRASPGQMPSADDATFTAEQLVAIAFVRDLLESGEGIGPTWEVACEELGKEAALELVFVVAWWAGFVPVLTDTLFALESPTP
jgi:alkylhydroperoxidase/carboxymuconolactone decarboxylase family protein YurZ